MKGDEKITKITKKKRERKYKMENMKQNNNNKEKSYTYNMLFLDVHNPYLKFKFFYIDIRSHR
jgi:hypothetical protein